MEPITLDFETQAIIGNPIIHPPLPVGVAIWIPGESPEYLAWGHPTDNNCTKAEAEEKLARIMAGTTPILFHNAGFDLSVMRHFDSIRYTVFDPDRVHDTMYLLFLADPYAATLSLKPSADRYLGMAATEQDLLYQWILLNVPGATAKSAGAYISRAPGSLVAGYAIGDVVRTRKLFDLLHARITEKGMVTAYDRERRLFPLVLDGTRRGIRIDRDTLGVDTEAYTRQLSLCEDRLESCLGLSAGDLDDDKLLADALERTGAVTEWVLTPKSGKRSMSKDNLKISDLKIKILMDYRSGLSTCLQTFMRPWLEMSRHDGRLHPNWNQVKQYREGGGLKGTQTGRLSSDSPNFQNVPTDFVDSAGNPLPVPEGCLPYPFLRRYCLPEQGHVWLKRDFSSQEIRILAHFEDGSLCEAYRANPQLDPHQMAIDLINQMIGVLYVRKDVKITGFSIIYGSGVKGLSGQLQRPEDQARAIKEAYLAAMPGVRDLMRDVQGRGRSGQCIRTWGGRIYFAEPSKTVDGRVWDFSYKLLNYLIQGSAADQTKEALCQWRERSGQSPDSIFLATVHDEINLSAPQESWKEDMKFLRECMNADRFDVPMLSEGFFGPNWSDLEKCE